MSKSVLPDYILADELVPDPDKRLGHWYHPQSDTVINLGADWGKVPVDGVITNIALLTRAELMSYAKTQGITVNFKMTKDDLLAALGSSEKAVAGLSDEIVGRRVEVQTGIYSGGHATITERAQGDEDGFEVRVLIDTDGREIPIGSVDSDLRFLTDDEIAADDAELAKRPKKQ